ncbi:MAG: hypothetical protein EOM23_00790 [Candidatus Moranbacteria bacterium]|nr:hypothetical protein [Candidatus Moranbacteria bacterium]
MLLVLSEIFEDRVLKAVDDLHLLIDFPNNLADLLNVFFVLGISTIIKPLPFNAVFDFDIAVCIVASLILFFIMFVGKKHTITKQEGFIMTSLYIFYIAFLVGKQ